jgi:hypothetical protein
MPQHARHFAALYDQFEDERQVADWGGDELFTRMPRPRAVDNAPAPRFKPAATEEPAPRRPLALVESPDDPRLAPAGEYRASRDRRPSRSGKQSSASRDRRPSRSGEQSSASRDRRPSRSGEQSSASRERRRTGEQAMRERAERLGLSVVEATREPMHRFDESGALIEPELAGRPTKVITGHPGEAPRPLPTVRSERRRPPRTPAEWIGPRPERIVGWAFALGLLLILIAISTADAATL